MILKSFFKFKKHHIGIEINGNNLRLVILKSNNNLKYKIIKISQKLSAGTIENGIIVDPSELINILKKLVNFYGIKGCKASTTIVSRLVVVKHLELPRMNDDELNEIMKWEITQNFPYSEQDAVYDWCKLGDLSNSTKIVMAAVPRDVACTYYETFNEAGIKLQHIDIVPASLKRWLLYLGSKNWPDIDVLTIGIVHVGDEITNLVIIKNGEIEFSRTIVLGAKSYDFIDELYRTLKYYESHFTNQIARLLLTGSLTQVNSLHNILARKIQIPVEIGMTALDDEIEPDFAVAVGLALRGMG